MEAYSHEQLQAAFAYETLTELERRLILGCMDDGKAAAWLHDLSESDFSDPVARSGFTGIRIAQARGLDLDLIVMRQIMADLGHLPNYLALINETVEVVTYGAVRAMVAYIKDESGRRAFHRAAAQIQADAADKAKPLGEVLERATKALGKAYGTRAREEAEPEKLGFLRMSEVLIEDKIADQEAEEKGMIRTLQTDISTLDRISPVEEGDYVVLQGCTGEGKSLLMSQFMRAWGKVRKGYAWSGELTKKQIYRRAAGQELGINPRDVSPGHMVTMSEQFARQIWVDNESPIGYERLIQKMQIWLLAHPDAGWFAIDYLQLLAPEDHKLITQATRALRAFALQNRLVGLVLVQPNERRIEERQDKRPRLTDISGSGNISKDASKIWAIHRPCIFDGKHDKRDARIYILKERDGSTRGTEIRLTFDSSCVTFRDGAPEGVAAPKRPRRKAEQQTFEPTEEERAAINSITDKDAP